MRFTNVVAGMLIAASAAVGVAVWQAETRVVDGEPRRVVVLVNRWRVYETPLARRCVRVAVPAGAVGAGIGYFASSGGLVGAALLGALALGTFSASWRETWPEKFGRAGANSQVADSVMNGLAGALLGAAGAAQLAKHHPRLPRRLQPPEPADASS